MFQSTPPARAATAVAAALFLLYAVFQSTPPARAATAQLPAVSAALLFQSTPPARAATYTL